MRPEDHLSSKSASSDSRRLCDGNSDRQRGTASKARALQEPTMERNNQEQDQALGDFFEARFGKELVKTIIEPLLSGIYAGDIYKMSLRATFPQFEQTVKKYGNLMDGLKESSMQTTIGAFRTLEGGLDQKPLRPHFQKKTCIQQNKQLTKSRLQMAIKWKQMASLLLPHMMR
ncbi:Protoporphyrinogen oxidase [Listeria monocytogenes N53-1]|nr:Protoporphyrinogen oxidase [Listeria monocytogenes N53-1]